MIKKIIISVCILLVLASGILFYVNRVLLPVQIKGIVTRALRDYFKSEATIGNIYYSPIKGLVIENIFIPARDNSRKTFIALKEASAQILILPLLRKKVIFPSLRLVGPEANIIRFEENLWNFSDLIKPAAPQDAPQSLPDVIISGLDIIGGRLEITDRSGTSEFNEVIDPINVKGSLALNSSLKFSGSIGFPSTQGQLAAEANFFFKDQSLKGRLTASRLELHRYFRFAPPLPINIRQMNIHSADLTLFRDTGKSSLSGSLEAVRIDIDPGPGSSLITSLNLEQFFATLETNGTLTFQGGINLKDTALSMAGGPAFRGNLKSHVNHLNLDKDSFSAELSAESHIETLSLPGGQSLSGDIKISEALLNRSGSDISIAANMDAAKTNLTLAPDSSLQGAWSLKDFSLKSRGRGFDIAGTLHSPSFDFQSGETRLLGSIEARTISANTDGQNLNLTTNLELKDISATIPGSPTSSTERKPISFKTALKAQGLKASLTNNTLSLDTPAALSDTEITLPGQFTFKGNPNLQIKISIPLATPQNLACSGSLDLQNSRISEIPTIGSVDILKLETSFANDQLDIKTAELSLLQTPMTFHGSISRFADPRIKISLNIPQLDLAKAAALAPELLSAQKISVQGNAAIEGSFDGELSNPSAAAIKGKITLKETSIEEGVHHQKITKVNGTAAVDTTLISWTELSAEYQGITYRSSGTLRDPANPVLTANLKSPNFSAALAAEKMNDLINVKSLEGNYYASLFNLNGQITLSAKTAPRFKAGGKIALDLNDLPHLLPPPLLNQVLPLKPAGILSLDVLLEGQGGEWQNYTSNLELTCPKFSLAGYETQNLLLQAKLKQGLLTPLTLEGNFYQGPFMIDGNIDLKSPGMPFKAVWKVDGTSLELLKMATPLKTREIRGNIYMDGKASGKISELSQMEGSTSLNINNGYLAELELLSRVLRTLTNSMQVGDIVITDATSDWTLAAAKVSTDNLTLKSRTVSILGNGWISWDQTMDMTFTPRIEPSTGEGGVLNVLGNLNPTEGVLKTRASGKISDPKIEHSIGAPTLIKKTLQNVLENVLAPF